MCIADMPGFESVQVGLAEEARFDGIFVLRTNTTLDPLSLTFDLSGV